MSKPTLHWLKYSINTALEDTQLTACGIEVDNKNGLFCADTLWDPNLSNLNEPICKNCERVYLAKVKANTTNKELIIYAI